MKLFAVFQLIDFPLAGFKSALCEKVASKKPIQFAMGFLLSILSSLVYSQTTLTALTTPIAPQRIASLNICIDQLLWELVPHERLVSISYLTADPIWSPIAEQVKGMPVNHGLAEEIVPLKPDVIFAGEFDAPTAIELLKKLNLRVERLPLPRTLGDINTQILQLAELVGTNEKAQQMVNNIDRQVAALQTVNNGKTPLTAFWYSANGVVIGDGTLEHELMQLAGLRNLAAERGMFGFNQLDLELLLSAKPQILIVERGSDDAYSLAREYLSHPALQHADFNVVTLPAGLSGCAATVISDVAAQLKNSLAK
ncbi:periplasmic binding protein, putative [Cellvibrio sp. BR]|uniref:ABC transporter substrate-binding protein n=1 Tax=Cellvibrio sp. BR TaxID=1134474 RepID=UPI0002601699|nr:ABC transporter substrate-binding protein [Cellvibrio sp. BR]EIK44911.1 periplasmic binding protein, putative [Cellvibrio sp. BR]